MKAPVKMEGRGDDSAATTRRRGRLSEGQTVTEPGETDAVRNERKVVCVCCCSGFARADPDAAELDAVLCLESAVQPSVRVSRDDSAALRAKELEVKSGGEWQIGPGHVSRFAGHEPKSRQSDKT